MGAEIASSSFKKHDYNEFRYRLEAETSALLRLIDENKMSDSGYSAGIEMEAWIIDKKLNPRGINRWFLNKLQNPQVVNELSRYNIELNGSPEHLSPKMFSQLQKEMETLWEDCLRCAKEHNTQLALAGILPTVKQSMFGKSSMSPSQRYKALNAAIFSSGFFQKPNTIHMRGRDELLMKTKHIMPASAATSFQFQLKVPISKFKETMNAMMVASAPMVALSANSPFLFGKNLWHESRVPLFEHAINCSPRHRDESLESNAGSMPRAYFANGYIKKGLEEVYIDNYKNHPVLLPVDLCSDPAEMCYLNLHNGTIWRWNRTVIGQEADGTHHVRIEHRSPSAGPSIVDSMANMAFFIGLTHELSLQKTPLESLLPYELCQNNFYHAAKLGLDAKVSWFSGQQYNMQELLLDQLIPMAKTGLQKLEIEPEQISYYIDDIIYERTKAALTGAIWQINAANKLGGDLKAMTQQYLDWQQKGIPVHQWQT